MESHVFSWSRSRESESFLKNCWSRSRESESGFQKCWSRSQFLKTAGVGVGSWSWFFKTAGVGVRSRNPKKSSDSTTLLAKQSLLVRKLDSTSLSRSQKKMILKVRTLKIVK